MCPGVQVKNGGKRNMLKTLFLASDIYMTRASATEPRDIMKEFEKMCKERNINVTEQ